MLARLRDFSTLHDHSIVVSAGFDALDHLSVALDHGAEHSVLAVQMRGQHGGHEELGPVGVGTGVGHGQESDL
jgi:hypothetical protein